jgi:uncharacterized protein (TIGR02246 family)
LEGAAVSGNEQAVHVRAWVDGYIQAWSSNDPARIAGLFTEDAVYSTEPYREPWRGRDEIVRRWLDRKDEPGETQFRWHPLTVTPEVAVVQGVTVYRDPPRTYSNLWVIRLDFRSEASGSWWAPRSSKPV